MKRWTFRIVLCLLFVSGGVVTTVAVAWSALWFEARSPQPGLNLASFFWDRPFAGLDELRMAREHGLGELSGRDIIVFHYGGWGNSEYLFFRLAEDPAETVIGSSMESLRVQEAGAPFHCLTGSTLYLNGSEQHQSLLEINAISDGLRLPIRPTLGLAGNTLFYAVIWFGLFFGIGATRKAIRRKRGRCEKCGYDLRGTPDDVGGPGNPGGGCSECGWGRQP